MDKRFLGVYSLLRVWAGGSHVTRSARHLIEAGYDIRIVQELLGHECVSKTMIDTHVLNKGGRGVTSPLDN